MSAVLDNITDFGIKFEKPVSILAAVWFAGSCTVYARFISLPEIPFITDRVALFLSAGFNGLWWGFLRPQITKRRAARLTQNSASGKNEHG